MLYARVPLERLGVLIGPGGGTKKRLEERTGSRLLIDSESGEVTIDESRSVDPSMALKARDAVTAIGRGFSEERAFRLLEEDEYLQVLEIKDFAKSKARVAQVRARLIGSGGKTRRLLEEMTGVDVSVYGHTVAVIAASFQLPVAVEALEMLLRGSEHSTVYRFLERKRAELRPYEMGF
jgi:ribosomal RNA assembly protein